ncbi:unnamed protein product, partial [Anisakis simplex]|uniref:Uncharacterized protein n=1 Tax=Anisakis simplex TaxID=6269 RepID=A0A0M3JNX2_ANISI
MGDERINLDYISKWRWALAQMAQYCIDNRLRTPLGKPAETFLKFENEIRRLALSSLTRKHANSGASSNPALDPSPTRSGVPDKEKDGCNSSAS